MKPPTYFVGSRLKVERANRHIQEIKSTLDTFLKSEFCELLVEPEGNSGNGILKLYLRAEPPSEIALMVGDAVHNLRAAMDYITSHYVGKGNDRITLPMGKKRDNVIKSAPYAFIKKALPDLADFIVDKIQPYEGGNFSVWETGSLDNIDKHKLLIPTFSIQGIANVVVEGEDRSVFGPCSLLVQGTRVVSPVAFSAKAKITNYGQPTANIFFPQGSCFENKAVIPTLLQLSQFMLKAIEAFEDFCFGQVPDPNAVKS
jgi:hypothetical protein